MPEVFPIKLSYTWCYLVKEGDKLLMIDASLSGFEKKFERKVKALGLAVEDINLIILTHVHHDHVGITNWVKEKSGAPVLVHEKEARILELGETPIPEGTKTLGKILHKLGVAFNFIFSYKPVKADILVSDILALDKFGFSATVVPTPGHTEGSISILFGTGESFVGDCCFQILKRKDVFPIFANDVPQLLKTWKTLLNSEAVRFYPGHGEAFDKNVLRLSFEKNQTRT